MNLWSARYRSTLRNYSAKLAFANVAVPQSEGSGGQTVNIGVRSDEFLRDLAARVANFRIADDEPET